MYVYATDLGFPAQNSSNEAKVIVRVTRNVHAPMFERDLYTKSVLETVPVGSNVIKLNANDRDSAVSYVFATSMLLKLTHQLRYILTCRTFANMDLLIRFMFLICIIFLYNLFKYCDAWVSPAIVAQAVP